MYKIDLISPWTSLYEGKLLFIREFSKADSAEQK